MIKGSQGDQLYNVAADVELAAYPTVDLWCMQFSGVVRGGGAHNTLNPGRTHQQSYQVRTAAMTSVRWSRSAPSSSRLMPSRSTTCGESLERMFAQRPALVGQGDVERALVASVALAG